MNAWYLICSEVHELIKNRRSSSPGVTLQKIEDMLVSAFAANTVKIMDQLENPMTQEEVEAWIMLKGQSGERWFTVEVIDPEMRNDPTCFALMEAIANTVHDGMVSQELSERMTMAEQDKPRIKVN